MNSRYNFTDDGESRLSSLYKKQQKSPQINYANWEDPNELVERLELLIEEKSIDNSNEMYKIIRELKEAGYIH